MSTVTQIIKKLAAEIAAHNNLAKQQAAAVAEAGVGALKEGAISPIKKIRMSDIDPEFTLPADITAEMENAWPVRELPTGLTDEYGATHLYIKDSPFGKYVTPGGTGYGADPFLVKRKDADDRAILLEYLKAMEE